MKDGIINVYKPAGMTSNDVIYRVRAAIGIKKLGHTGTLDPMAEGVLPILINKGTRIAEYLDWDLKTYETVITLGTRTDSLDITGEVLDESDWSFVTEEDVLKAFDELLPGSEVAAKDETAQNMYPVFSGVLDQIPPNTSAVRINGRRLYEYVHSGEEIPEDVREKIRPRKVWIDRLTVDEIALPEIRFTVRCSKGTYIRSISRDIGEMLGCGAVMKELKRTESGAFTAENVVFLTELVSAALTAGRVEFIDEEQMKIRRLVPFGEDIPEDMERFILGVDFPLNSFGEAVVSPEDADRFLDGWHLSYREARVTKEPEGASWMDRLGAGVREYDRAETANNIGSHAGLKLHPEYLKTYKIYKDDHGVKTFVGIASHSDKYHKLIPEKVFMRR